MKNTERNPDPEERATARDLSDICAEIFTLILQLRRTSDFGNLEVLRQRIKDLLGRVEAGARDAGYSSEDVQLVLFACVAFLDETIIASDWSQKDKWLARPLQLEYFNRFDAGEEFFVKLDLLRQRPRSMGPVLKVYHMCMSLGFRGKHQFLEREKIRSLIEETYAELFHGREKTVNRLSPHGARKDEIVAAATREIPVWVIAVFAAGIGFFFYLIMTVLISRIANDVASNMNPPVTQGLSRP
jgi:type VI secretion system protein ImpK